MESAGLREPLHLRRIFRDPADSEMIIEKKRDSYSP